MNDNKKPEIHTDKNHNPGEINIISENLAEANGLTLFGNLEKVFNSLPVTSDFPFTDEEAQESEKFFEERGKRIKSEIDSYDLSHLSVTEIEKLFSQVIIKNGIESDVFWGIMEKINFSYPDLISHFIQENFVSFGTKFIDGVQKWDSCSKSYFIDLVVKFHPELTSRLIPLLNDKDIDIQRSTCFAMANFSVKEAIPKILDLAKNHDCHYVKYDAITALGIFADESVIPDLIELQKDHTFVHEDTTIAMVAAQAIKEIRSRKI
jgi:HEAT repeats